MADQRAVTHILCELEHTRPAYSANTHRARMVDLTLFFGWCQRATVLPHSIERVIGRFVTDLGIGDQVQAPTHKPASIIRAISSLSFAFHHSPTLLAASPTDPTKSAPVKLALKTLKQQRSQRQTQAGALNWIHLETALAEMGNSLRDVRDRAMVMLAYDTLCRRSEVAALMVTDLEVHTGADAVLTHGTCLLRESKTDQLGAGEEKYLSPFTVELVQDWLTAAGIETGALFRGVDNAGRINERISPEAVHRALKRVAGIAGLDMTRISGHSCRVGATQDMAAADMDLALIMRAGNWKSPAMPAKYAAKLMARRGGMAKLAEQQVRVKPKKDG